MRFRFGIVITALASVAPAVSAQELELAGGWQYLQVRSSAGAAVPVGWGASVASGESDAKLVAEVGGHDKGSVDITGPGRMAARLMLGVPLTGGRPRLIRAFAGVVYRLP